MDKMQDKAENEELGGGTNESRNKMMQFATNDAVCDLINQQRHLIQDSRDTRSSHGCSSQSCDELKRGPWPFRLPRSGATGRVQTPCLPARPAH